MWYVPVDAPTQVAKPTQQDVRALSERVNELEEQLGRLAGAEEQVLGARAQAQALLDNIPHMAWMKDAEGVFLAVNEPFARATGLAKHDILGKVDGDIWPAELAERYRRDDQRVMATGRKFFAEEPIADSTGQAWFETFKTPVRDAKGSVIGTVGLARDITRRKHQEREQQLLQERMQQVQQLESLGVLAGGIAHEFNNLLMGVLANAELALSELTRDASDGLHQRLLEIRSAALTATELTQQMLAYSGRGRFVVRPVSLNEMVRGIGHLLSAAVSRNARVSFELDADLPHVMADAAQMHQLAMSLITNASDALAERAGKIVIRTGTERVEGPVSDLYGPTALPAGDYVFLQVSDDGCGMDEATRARLFEPFFTTKFTGRGLGLSTVQGIVRGHGGGIVLRSVVEQGTTIKVLLPRADHQQVEPKVATRAGLEPPPERALVLLVDDDQRVRSVTELLLRSVGFDVLAAASGRDAIDGFSKRPGDFSFVLLDLTMPDLNGDQVLVELRRCRRDVPVIISSGYSEHELGDRICADEIACFLQKPYTFEALQHAIRQTIGYFPSRSASGHDDRR